MKKKLFTSILALVCAIACAVGLAACGGGGGGPMKLNKEQWDSAFTAARAWEDYTLDFRLSLHKNYVLAKDEIRDSGVTVQDVIMQFSLDSTNEQGLRAHASRGLSAYNEDGSVISEDDDSSFYSVENGKLFCYYYDENDNARKYESAGTGTAEERFAEHVETFDDYLPMFVFTKGGKTYKIDELNQALKFTPGFAYEGKLGFELDLEAIGGGYENENPYKTESAPVLLSVYHTVYDAESGIPEWTEKLPEDWSEWEGGIHFSLHFETEFKGEKYLVMIEMSYRSNDYALNLPETLYETRFEDGERYEYRYNNVYGQAGPAQSD